MMKNKYLKFALLFAVMLTGKFAGIQPHSVFGQDDASRPTLYIVGDSTASNSSDLGWGSHLGKYFDDEKIEVINRARGGRSSRTFQSEGLWDNVVETLKPDDFVLIQFGHNDGGQPGVGKDRSSLKGLGEETVTITNIRGEEETVHTFGWYMRKYIEDTLEKGATPIVLSLTVRNIWEDGKVERGSGDYGEWSEEIAESENAVFVDLTNIIAKRYEKMGQEPVKAFFPIDHTHTSAEGANLNAQLVIAGLKALESRSLTRYLSRAGEFISADEGSPDRDVFLRPDGIRTPFPTPGQLSKNYHPDLPTLFIIGDSTVKNGRDDGAQGLWGWGNPIAAHFDATKINVENQALGGMSSRTYISAGYWDKVLELMRPGDFVMMQFGHNDSSPVNDDSRARGTIHSNGEETEEIDNLLTGKHEIVHSYGWYLRKFVAEARERDATPIICSLIPRNNWSDGKVNRADSSWGLWAKQAAEQVDAFFIDLNQIVATHYDALGQDAVKALFPVDGTHTGWAGAVANASWVVDGIRSLDGELKDYLLVSTAAEK